MFEMCQVSAPAVFVNVKEGYTVVMARRAEIEHRDTILASNHALTTSPCPRA